MPETAGRSPAHRLRRRTKYVLSPTHPHVFRRDPNASSKTRFRIPTQPIYNNQAHRTGRPLSWKIPHLPVLSDRSQSIVRDCHCRPLCSPAFILELAYQTFLPPRSGDTPACGFSIARRYLLLQVILSVFTHF